MAEPFELRVEVSSRLSYQGGVRHRSARPIGDVAGSGYTCCKDFEIATGDPMSSAADSRQATMDPTQLYREDIFTDRRVGTIRQLTPVSADGQVDPKRPVLYVGQAQVITPVGAVPLSFELEATTLSGAIAKFGEAAEQAMQQTVRELQELRREQASSLVIPEAGSALPSDLIGGRGGGGRTPRR